MDARCSIELLGKLRVVQGERTITRFRTEKTAGLLAYLAYHLGRPHPREVLVEMLWPWSEPRAGRTTLRVALSSLRRQLEPPGVPSGAIIRADRGCIELNPETVSTDVQKFASALRGAGDATSATQRINRLREAVALYEGPLLPGHYQDWVRSEQERIADMHMQAVRNLVELLHGADQFEEALNCARLAVSADPLREEAHQLVLYLLLSAGRVDAARQHFEEMAGALREELGEEPSDVSAALWERIESAELPDAIVTPALGQRPPVEARETAGTPPAGTVTFLLTDIEGSTRLRESAGALFNEAIDVHHRALRGVFATHRGHEAKELGDGFIVAFEHATDAVRCAVACQRQLHGENWPGDLPALRVRMAIFTGEVGFSAGGYRGLALHEASRLLDAGHGGQILCSEVAASLVGHRVGEDVETVDLGVHRLRDISHPQRILQITFEGMQGAPFPPLRAERGYVASLPTVVTNFVGREDEIQRIETLLGGKACRLVTLTGPGGSGKTRLAVEAARHLADHFRGAVWFVPLEDITDADLINGAIAEAMQLPRSGRADPLVQAARVMATQPTLLVLDNAEQVVDGVAATVETLLSRAPDLRIVVTSRQKLELQGEREFAVLPLMLPEPEMSIDALAECPSVRLFVDRAQSVRADFQITEANAPSIAELCHRLEGMPLALELAATRVHVLTPSQMVEQLADRFAFLVGRKRDAAARHRTLRATIEWSYRLLAPEQRGIFAGLSVFRGGWSVEAAESVCGHTPIVDALEGMRDQSLLVTREHRGIMRFDMLESIREFAASTLDARARAELSERHARFFLELAQRCSRAADTPDEAAEFTRMETDLLNIRAAMDWASSTGDQPMIAQFAGALSTFLWRRGLWAEHSQRVQVGLAAAETLGTDAGRLVCELLRGLSRVAYDRGELETAEQFALRGRQAASDTLAGDCEGASLNMLGLIALARDDIEGAETLFNESLPLYDEAGHGCGRGMALHNLGVAAWSAGDPARARKLFEEAMPARRKAGDLRGTAETQNNLALLAEEAGKLDEAAASYREALRLFLDVEDVYLTAVVLCNLGEIALLSGDAEEAAAMLGPAAHTLGHLESVHADHASTCLAKALDELSEAPATSSSSWREDLLQAANRALDR